MFLPRGLKSLEEAGSFHGGNEMLDPFPRWLLALTAIVAIAAISVGIKDHFQQKNATSETSILPRMT